MARDATSTLLKSSWWAIALGLVFEGLQLGAMSLTGTNLPAVAAVVADTAQKVCWSSIICVALACGTAATRAGAGTVGVIGLIAAPLAFGAARALHKSVGQALSIGALAGGPSPWLLAGIKAVEYAVFGYLITRLVRRPELRLPAYLRVGLLIGAAFGGVVLWIMDRAAPSGLPASTLVARGVNEVLFPVGCASLLWVTNMLAQRSRP